MNDLIKAAVTVASLINFNLIAATVTTTKYAKSDNCYLTFSGGVEKGDADKVFNSFLYNCDGGRVESINIDSIGGNFTEGARVSDVIREMGLNTAVYSGKAALSAAFSILMAGSEVSIYSGARTGHHAPWVEKKQYNELYKDSTDTTPVDHFNLGEYFMAKAIKEDMLDIPAWLIIKYITNLEGSMYYLTLSDLIKLDREGYVKYIPVPRK
tara:strand:+ start:625 stop:1257 length:633 start_codon:yes stop_codon:yes gene_type:complete